MRFVKLPTEPIQMFPQDANDPPARIVTIREIFAAMFRSRQFLAVLDVFATFDLRAKLMEAAPGDTVELRDDEHAAVAAVCTKPEPFVFSPSLLYSPDMIRFLRSIVDAPRERPATS